MRPSVDMFRSVLCCAALVLLSQQYVECERTVMHFPIGGIFYDDSQATAFRYALKKRSDENLGFEPNSMTPSAPDSFTILREVCALTSRGGWAALVDGSEDGGACGALCQLLSKLQVPQLALSWRPPEPPGFGLAYHPRPADISSAFAAYIKFAKWETFALLYEDDGGLIRLQQILLSRPVAALPVTVRRLNPHGDNKSIFKSLLQQYYFVLDCNPDNIVKYLNEIAVVNNHTNFQEYLLTSLDTHTVELRRKAPRFDATVTTMYMTDLDDRFWSDVGMDSTKIRLQTALAVDAATHVSMAIEKVVGKNSNLTAVPSICQKKKTEMYEPWLNGSRFLEAMQERSMYGLTGNVEFRSGYRTNFQLKYYTTLPDGSIRRGFWDSSNDKITQTNVEKHDVYGSNSTKIYKVVSRIGKPYFGENNNTGEFEGFAVDLIDAIFKHINKESTDGRSYEYKFYKAEENNYQKMIEDLQSHTADLAICDLTMTSERQGMVDFSAPFMSLGISILAKKPPKVDPNKYSFLEPLALDLWLYLGTAYIIVSFVLLICARMSQEDWVNPHPCDRNPEVLENIWDLSNCTWLAMGTIMTQGCDILPRAAGSRWVTGMWWFFALIITASYTANMSTFLSNSRRSSDISSAKDLAEQNSIKYGTVQKQSTYKFFKNSNDSTYKKIFSVMESEKPSVYAKDNIEGLERVQSGNNKYVFFMESTSVEYYIQRDCTLQMVGGWLDSKEYGIAMPKRSPLRFLVDAAILQLQEDGKIQEMKDIWWKEKDNTEKCEEKAEEEQKQSQDNGSLQMENTSGIFMVLLAGSMFGIAFALIDFVLYAHKIAVKENVTWREAMLSEWRSSLNPRVLSKPVAPPRSAVPSLESESTSRGHRSTSRAVSVLRAAQSFINLDKVY